MSHKNELLGVDKDVYSDDDDDAHGEGDDNDPNAVISADETADIDTELQSSISVEKEDSGPTTGTFSPFSPSPNAGYAIDSGAHNGKNSRSVPFLSPFSTLPSPLKNPSVEWNSLQS
jgi:hypothetical protein